MQKLGPSIFVGGFILLIAVLLVFFIGVPIIIDNKVTDETQLQEGSETWEKWRDAPIPIFLSFYIFDIQNPEALENGTDFEPFQVVERGPYVYQEKRQKTILAIDKEADTVTYEESIHYYFRRDMSVGDETDRFNIINAPFIIVSTVLKKSLYGVANLIIDYLWRSGERFVRQNVTVNEMIFSGFDTQIYTPIVALSPGGAPEEFADNSFSFYKGKNGSTEGVFTIKAGVKDYKTFGKIEVYNGMKELTWWTDPKLLPYQEQYCNKINGSDGSIFPPFVKKDWIMRIFNTDICRSLFLTYNKEITFDGIKGYRFTIPKTMLDHPDINPDNRCFCVSPGGGLRDHCAGGVIRIFPCKSGAPIVSSNPHLLDADEEIREMVVGLEPNRDKHQTFIEVEPRSGQLLQAMKRVQINMELQALTGIARFRDIPEPSYIVPIFWAQEHAYMDKKNTDDMKDKLVKPLKVLEIVQWTIISLAIVVTVGGLGLTCYRRQKNK